MVDLIILFLISSLLIFTPIAFGAIELWAFSLMELGILLMIVLYAIQKLIAPNSQLVSQNSAIRNPQSAMVVLLLCLFFLLILLQMIPLPKEVLRVLSPKTYALRLDLSLSTFHLSFVPFATQIEFFKWLTLSGFYLFLLFWKYFDQKAVRKLIFVVLCVGVFESLYGMFEFFTGHKHILHLRAEHLVSSVTGTFINRNAFAGYLLMVIPLSMGYLFSREAHSIGHSLGWRHRLSSLDGKSLLIAFGIVLMILGLLFSASRMGIASLLLSFSLISLLFRNPERRLSRAPVLIFGLALLWALWIGLDAVISRFFTTSESFEDRWRLWANTFQIIRDYPLFGAGLGTFTQVFPMYRSFHIRGLVTHAENDFLQLISEVGLLGIGLLGVLFFYLFYRGVSGIRSLSFRDPKRYIGVGGMVGIVALMFHSLVERNIQIPANAFLYAFIWTIVLRIGHPKRKEDFSKG
jgi:O-antigen ligase